MGRESKMNALQKEIQEVIEPLVTELAALNTAFQAHIASTPVKMLNVHEAAELLGCAEETVRRKVKSGKLKCKRVGNQIRIDPADLV
jgi:excisionase family DNA binding protein